MNGVANLSTWAPGERLVEWLPASLFIDTLLQDEGRGVTARSLLPGIKVVLTSPSLSQSRSGFQHAVTTLRVNMSSYENAREEAWTIPRKRMRGACRHKRPCFTTTPSQ